MINSDFDHMLEPTGDSDPVEACVLCGDGIYEGDPYWDVGSGATCESCIDSMKRYAYSN